MTASVELPTALYDDDGVPEFFRRAVERVRALPGVREATFSSDLPWTNYDENTSFSIVGRQFPDGRGTAGALSLHHGGLPAGDGHAARRRPRPRRRRTEGRAAVVLLNEAPRASTGATPSGRGRRARESVGRRADGGRRDRRRARHAVARPRGARAVFSAAAGVVPAADVPGRADRRRVSRRSSSPIRRALARDRSRAAARERAAARGRGRAAIATRRLTLWLVATFGVTSLLPRRRRDLRRDDAGRGPAPAGVRRPPGARRDARRHPAARLLERRDGMTSRGWPRGRAGPRLDAAARVAAVRRDAVRSADVRRRRGAPPRGGRRRRLPAGSPGHTNQRGGRASRRVVKN